jgi:hypothetical protein
MDSRTFTIVSVGDTTVSTGKYIGRGPFQAARKAFNKYCHHKGLENFTGTITIQETTLHSKYKKYTFTGSRKKIEPKIISSDNFKYTVNYEIKINRVF